jgi:uncharacterized protein (TIGR02646 family)
MKKPASNRKRVYKKFDGLCAYCGCFLNKTTFHVDHIQAKSLNGNNDIDNLFPSCLSCNIRKGAMSVERFRKELYRDVIQLQRDNAKFRMLRRYGIINVNVKNIEFYFERRNHEASK